jgi:glutathione synthase/RimK-type ligase-like ATP-grasp enzyme
MQRHANGWITNRALGATCIAAVDEDEISALALQAVAAMQCSYAGVDIIRDIDGKPWVLEVNGVPAWFGLQNVCKVDVAAKIADFAARSASPAARTSAL